MTNANPIPHVTPITAENCHLLTPSALFVWSLNKVIDQGCRAMSKDHAGACQYRGSGGNKCAVGHCIPDSHYDKEMEGANIRGLFLPAHSLGSLGRTHVRLFEEMQRFSLAQQTALYTAQVVHDICGVGMAKVLVDKSISDEMFGSIPAHEEGNNEEIVLANFLRAVGCTEDFVIWDDPVNGFFAYKQEEAAV